MIKFPAKILRPIWKFLKREEKRLKKRKKELKKEDPFVSGDRLVDNAPDTDAAEQFSHARVSALIKEINKNLIRVKKTLSRIKIGKYGVCRKCGQLINTERLAVDPTAEHCLDCEKKRASA